VLCGRHALLLAPPVQCRRRCCLVVSLAGNEILAANDIPTRLYRNRTPPTTLLRGDVQHVVLEVEAC